MNQLFSLMVFALVPPAFATFAPPFGPGEELNCWAPPIDKDPLYGFTVQKNPALGAYAGVPTKQDSGNLTYVPLSGMSKLKITPSKSKGNCENVTVTQAAPNSPDTDNLKLVLNATPDSLVGAYEGTLNCTVNGKKVEQTVFCYATDEFVSKSSCLKVFNPDLPENGAVFEHSGE